ncbi:Transcription termination protein NusB [Arcticibacter svalbardensis MN12-7]|uniref:Transcription termination protein NusB n=1 Tax=Arcticibacter svalbardensis MN12-7 TaxID=1150600 RepID=R9GP10_9SPHI|nr:transcription antitermination factor NusB [Arcticibacter svalbardensis]EOR93260.1 Transcription termination protein NusB [Arcticibacter svalbardensis MN12-7]
MLNRRQLRVKVLQVLYAYQASEDKVVKTFEKKLLESVDEVYEMYISLLGLLVNVADYVLVDADERANKHRPDETDLHANTKLNTNKFIQLLRDNPAYQAGAQKYALEYSFDREVIKDIFNILKSSEAYEAYLLSEDTTLRSEKDIIKYIFKKIIRKTPGIEQVFEEKFINWSVDKDVLEAMMAKTFSNFQSEVAKENKLALISASWSEDRDYILDLTRRVITFDQEFQKYIADKTEKWDAERIAVIDILLMKMAISELVHFPEIPVKVTMNEYIEIAKEFSTPKSNLFINGILDKIMLDLRAAGKIRKTGRGLIE